MLLVSLAHWFYTYMSTILIYFLLGSYWCVVGVFSLTNFTSISPLCSSIFYWSVIGQLLGIYWDVVLTNFTSIYPLFSSSFIAQLLGCCWCWSHQFYSYVLTIPINFLLCGYWSVVGNFYPSILHQLHTNSHQWTHLWSDMPLRMNTQDRHCNEPLFGPLYNQRYSILVGVTLSGMFCCEILSVLR